MAKGDTTRNNENQKIVNAIVKNYKNGKWKTTRRLKPKDCKVGDVVLDFQNAICEIKEVKHNSNKHGDTKIFLNNLRNDQRSISCSHDGVFSTIWKLEQ